MSTECQGDFRALGQGYNLYRSKHVTVVEWHNDIQCYRGMVRPTMKKDRLYRAYIYCNGLQKIEMAHTAGSALLNILKMNCMYILFRILVAVQALFS